MKNEFDRREFLERLTAGCTAAGAGMAGICGCSGFKSLPASYKSFQESGIWQEKIEPKDYGITLDSSGKPSEPVWPVSFPSPIIRVDDVPEPKNVTAPDFHHMGFENLIKKMSRHDFRFYRTQNRGPLAGPDGLIARDDVVVIKINILSMYECGINTDVLRGLIRRILDHPEGFSGEVVLCDYRRLQGPANSADPNNTAEKVADSFPEAKVSYYQFSHLTSFTAFENQVADGFVRLEEEHSGDPEYDRLSYPKFTTKFGAHIDFRHGVWNGSMYDGERMKIINYSILKDHTWMGTTNTLKNMYGCLDIGTFDLPTGLHPWWRTHVSLFNNGLMGRYMKHVRRPDLNLVDAISIIHQHPFGPDGIYRITPKNKITTRVNALLAAVEPITLEYYACKEILYPIKCITPCDRLFPKRYSCINNPPCRNGICERHNPDSEIDTIFDSEEKWERRLPFDIQRLNLKWFPFNATNQIIHTSSMALYGKDVRNDYVLV